MEGNLAEAEAFLRWARPDGPWVLTAIPPDRKSKTDTRTFKADEGEALRTWLAGHCGRQNLYWMVNRARTTLTTKAAKTDVEAVEFLHVDLDPVAGRDMTAERQALLSRLEAFNPPAHAVVDSGGGYQGFWRLEEPIWVGGDVPRMEADVEPYNVQLSTVLGGDNCHNADRIMRIPGTVNIPTDKKRAAGRVETLARVVLLEAGSWPLHDFLPAARVQSPRGEAGRPAGEAVRLSSELPVVAIDDLPERVSPRTRMLIIQGGDPDDPTRYSSRSQVVFAVTCELIRAGCSDDVIASVLLNREYGVSEHNYAQPRPVAYVARQVQRAREHVEEPMLRVLNERHCVIADLGGRCRVISEVMDLSMIEPRTRISKQSFDDFRARYMNQRVQVGTDKKGAAVYRPLGGWWLEHPMRRQFTSMAFAPGRELEDTYNLWQGFSCEPVPGSNHEPYLAHLRDNICSGDLGHFRWLERWMARAVQKPGVPGEVAVVLRGGKGTGKGTTANLFGSLWGRHYIQVNSAKHLVGQFNAHLRDCVLLFADEAFFAGDKQHQSTLQGLVTEPTLIIEPKGVDAEATANCVHLIMASNSDWVVPAGADERRYMVLDVSDRVKQDPAYFAPIRTAMSTGGRESLLHHLMTLDLKGFDVRTVPQTAALQDQKMLSLGPEEGWWYERLQDGRLPSTSAEWFSSSTKDRVHGDYLLFAERQRIMRRMSPSALGKFLGRELGEGWPRSTQRVGDVEKEDGRGGLRVVRERAYWYDFPPLETCRRAWDTRHGGKHPWPEEADPGGVQGLGVPY